MAPKRKQGPASGPSTPGKRLEPVQLEYDRAQEARAARVAAAAAAARPVRLRVTREPAPPLARGEGLVFMALDVVEEAQGRFHVWGTTAAGASVLLRLTGFQPYFYVAAPKGQAAVSGDEEARGSQAADTDIEWDEEQLERLRGLLNRQLPSDCRLTRVEALRRTPIMFYRPDRPQGDTFMRLVLGAGASAKRGAAAFEKAMASGHLRHEGLVWRDLTVYEAEVQPLQRLLADVPLSGGAWLYVPPAPEGASSAQAQSAAGWQDVPPAERISSCDVEVAAPCQAVCCLTPDATQLADPAWSPFPSCLLADDAAADDAAAVPPAAAEAAAAAKRGDIAGLRMCVTDVLCAAADGADRVAVPSQGDPVVAVTATFFPFATARHSVESTPPQQQQQQGGAAGPPQGSDGLGGGELGGGLEGEEEGEGAVVVASLAAVAGGPVGAGPRRASATQAPGLPGAAAAAAQQETLVFLLHPAAAAVHAEVAERSVAVGGGAAAARVLLFASEAELLLTWAECVRQADPDVVALFEVNDTLAVLQQRFAALGLEGGALQLSRLLPRCARPLSLKKVTMYSAQWVRSQSRMSSTSNQETWRADIDGRIVVDVLRQVLTAQNLASFSLVDCVQSLLGQTIEVLRPGRLAALAGLAGAPQQPLLGSRLPPPAAAAADALRIARYALRRGDAVASLLHRLATLPEMVEMARATGLTLQQAAYNAQMIRTYSLLLRTARRQGFLVPGRQEAGQLQEHTFILHPVEEGTVGLYKQPVAILDFASLYPSIYRAHNLCYTTLVHSGDLERLPPEQLTVTPTGAAFVKPDVRPGILPGILAALISARAATREQLKAAADPAARAVLDSRQKALKVTANALYGFTGAAASPLQCIQLADSCLAYGAQSCRRAKEVLEAAAAGGQLAPHGGGARVIYGHTDSLFVLLPQAADPVQAIAAGRLASRVVSAAFPPPMELKFERVCQPFMLLHVNRYAGRAFEREEDVERGGELICKGVKSMWRQTAPILRTTLHGALERILMRDDLRGALAFVAGEVRRLLSGRVELHELVMTGGLWRLTGEQVESAAAEAGPSTEEVRGPHAALAVRLSQRDPGRSFVLGERLQYVLLAGERLQEDAAEDPLTAARAGLEGDYSLYWKNKLIKPLQEVFKAAVPPAQQGAVLAELLGGDHTRVRVDALSPPPPALGPASPPPRGRGRGSGGGGGGGTPARQSHMGLFFRPVPKCLGCRASMPSYKGPLDDAPGLCDSCAGKEGRWEETYLGLLDDQAAAEARQSAAYSACAACHSGGASGPVLCENGECPFTFTRLACSSRVQQVDKQLRRLDIF